MIPTPRILVALLAFAALLGPDPAGAFTTAEAKAAMTVTLVRSDSPDCGPDCPEWLALTGRIVPGSQTLLAAALARLGRRRLPILLDSPGGESTVGLAMGRMIRAHRLTTTLATTVLTDCEAADRSCQARLRSGEHPGHLGPAPGAGVAACASACVFVLAGGVDRAVAPGAYVGVHQAMQIQTFHPVVNTFRVLRQRIGGRTVEISRTLVATRALPTRVVKGAAPASLYSEFDRYLLGMGIDESIMPLMRATPPSGIHWLTLSELASTRIANDTTEAGTLVAREAASRAEEEAAAATLRSAQAAAAGLHPVQVPAALTLDDGRRWTGTITWRIDATTRPVPVLVGDWHLPERHLRGSVEIVPVNEPSATSSFTVSLHPTSDAGPDAVTILALRPPQSCDPSLCMSDISEDPTQAREESTFHVVRNWRGDFLMQLHKRDWLVFDARTEDGWGRIALTLSSSDNHAIDLWEKLCCNFAATDDPWTAPATLLPPLPAHPQPFLVSGIGPVMPIASGAKPASGALEMAALFDALAAGRGGYPTRVPGSMTWTPLLEPGTGGRPGEAFLQGVADLPAARVNLRIKVRRSEAGVLGRLTLDIRATAENEALFGSPTLLTVKTIYDRHGHTLLLADSVTGLRWDGGYTVTLDIPETGPIAGAIQLAFSDTAQRRITLALPIDPATAALLQAAARGDDPSGS